MGKHWLELASALSTSGWMADVADPQEISIGSGIPARLGYPAALREFIRKNQDQYDAIEYDHSCLPYPRRDFSSRPLMIARCMLLHHHFLSIPIPAMPGIWPRIRHELNRWRRTRRLKQLIARTDLTVHNADLTMVSNRRDAEVLAKSGADPERIAVLPLGLTRERLDHFSAVPSAAPHQPVVGFVGTFDPRKGMRDFPRIFEHIRSQVPEVRFRLLGTAGLLPDAKRVLDCFPRHLRPLISVQPRYDPEELPKLLGQVSVGVFPSRVESFGYGVLEMLAASIPVIAYDAPGPDMMLPEEYRVPPGDHADLASKVCQLLKNPETLHSARLWARHRAHEFDWESIAARTALIYDRAAAVPRVLARS